MLWIYVLAVELFRPVRVLVWTIGNLRTQMPDERSQQKMVWAFLGIQLSQVQVIPLNVSVQMKGQRWERIAFSFDYLKAAVDSLVSKLTPHYRVHLIFLSFFPYTTH